MPFSKAFSLFIAFIFCFSTIAPISYAGEAEIVAADVFGEVQLTRGNTTTRIETGTTLETNDRVKTIGKSTVDFVWDQKVGYRLLGQSECKITQLADKTFHIEVLSGNTIFNVDKLEPNTDLRIATPTAVAAVRGTLVLVSFLGAVASFIVSEGLIDVTWPALGGDPFQVPAGKALDVDANTTQGDLRDATQAELRTAGQASTVPTKVGADHNFRASDKIDDTPGNPVKPGKVDGRATTVDNVGQDGDDQSAGDSNY